MRKIIAFVLLAVMLLSLSGCGKQTSGTAGSSSATSSSATESSGTSAEYSIKHILLYQATTLAQQLGTTVKDGYMQRIGASAEEIAQAKVFSAAANPQAVSAAAFLSAASYDLEPALYSVNDHVGSEAQKFCAKALRFTAQFVSPLPLQTRSAVYLQYGQQCHFVVFFEPLEENRVAATVYPMFSNAAARFLDTYHPTNSFLNTNTILDSCEKAENIVTVAQPSGETVGADYYIALARSTLLHLPLINEKTLTLYSAQQVVITQAMELVARCSGDRLGIAVYTFPDDLADTLGAFSSDEAAALARQYVYLSWSDRLTASLNEVHQNSNTLLNGYLDSYISGVSTAKNEAPVLVVIGYNTCSILVTIYPSGHNTYLCRFAFLPCAYSDAMQKIEANGLTQMQ